MKDVGTAFTEVRTAKGFQAIARQGELQTSLERSGLASSRSIVVALVTKLLRAGSSAHTDRVVHLLNKAWRRHSTDSASQLTLASSPIYACSTPPHAAA